MSEGYYGRLHTAAKSGFLLDGVIVEVRVEDLMALIEDHDSLQKRDRWLYALEAAGIDNTDAYDYAFDILREWDEEDEQ